MSEFHPVVAVQDLYLKLDGRSVLSNVSIDFPAGSFTTIMGPGGSGKSTILRLIAGLLPQSSQLEIWGSLLRPRREEFAYVPQRARASGLSLRVLLAECAGESVFQLEDQDWSEWLAEEGLSHLASPLDSPADPLPRAHQQILRIAAARWGRPKVLLLDEPFAGVFSDGADELLDYVKRIKPEHTIIHVEHHQARTRMLADRVALLAAGQLVEIADTATFFTSPRSPHTAQFIRSGGVAITSVDVEAQVLSIDPRSGFRMPVAASSGGQLMSAERENDKKPSSTESLAEKALHQVSHAVEAVLSRVESAANRLTSSLDDDVIPPPPPVRAERRVPTAVTPVLTDFSEESMPRPNRVHTPTPTELTAIAAIEPDELSTIPSPEGNQVKLLNTSILELSDDDEFVAEESNPRGSYRPGSMPSFSVRKPSHRSPSPSGPRGRGTQNFSWLIKDELAGCPRPGIVEPVSRDLDRLSRAGVDVVVTLTQTPMYWEESDLSLFHEVCHFPIPDMKAPDAALAREVVHHMENHIRAGRSVAYHCRAGLGRTGTMLVMHLIGRGMEPRDALKLARSINAYWVQSTEQEEFLFAQPVGFLHGKI